MTAAGLKAALELTLITQVSMVLGPRLEVCQTHWDNTAAAAAKSLQSCPTVRPHRRQPTRLHHPWDSPGKNTGVGCHFLLRCIKVKSESEVAQSVHTNSKYTYDNIIEATLSVASKL